MNQLDKIIQRFYIQVIVPPIILVAITFSLMLINIHHDYDFVNRGNTGLIVLCCLLFSVILGLRLNVRWTIKSLSACNHPKNFELRRRNNAGKKIFLTTKSEQKELENLYRRRVYNEAPIAFPDKKKEIYFSKWKSIGNTMLFWGVLIAGIIKTTEEEIQELDSWMIIIMVGLIMLLFALGLNSFWKVFNQNPALTLSENGIENDKGLFITWESVKNFTFHPKYRNVEIDYQSRNENKTEIIDYDLMKISKEKLQYYMDLYFRKNIKKTTR
jgi:hypothetical protein